jgi:8-oxo-dGTP pyrophosphatase MutT (NUDIX family)
MLRAAGILIQADTGEVLFLKRSKSGDHKNEWCIPGGGIESGESPERAAIRELEEECGVTAPQKALSFWTRRVADDVDYTTFTIRNVAKFDPWLNSEHTGFLWAEPEHPPRPLHPGCEVVLRRCGWNELDIARAIRDGELSGPQQYENIWLFPIRITGTGEAYRHKWKEYVYRDPAIYLNDDFLARCNGLPVILEHPRTETLNTDEYKDRNIGSIFLPYIKGEEVWGIAKVIDEDGAQVMLDNQLSTSPAVVWRDPDVNNEIELADGKKYLIEGHPTLLDHIAICRQGVWDKGGEPTGVELVATDAIDPDQLEDCAELLEEIAGSLGVASDRLDNLEA